MTWAISGSGSVVSGNAKNALSADIASGTVTAASGEIIFVHIEFDNVTSTTPTVSSITKPGGETNSWAKIASHDSSNATGAAGCRGELWAIVATTSWSQTVTATLSSLCTAKSIGGRVFAAGGSLTARGVAQSGTSTGGAPTIPFQSGNQPQTGDLVICMASNESNGSGTGDTDTTNGSWVTGATSNTTGSSAATNVGGHIGYKIVTATGNQTFNPSMSGDSGVCGIVLQPGAAPNEGSASGTFAADGTSTSSRASEGSSTGSFDEVGAATAVRDSLGAVNAPVAFDGAATGSSPNGGTATGTFDETATVEDYGNPWTYAVEQTNPYLWWRFADSVGSGTAADATGNGHTGTVTSAVFGQTSLVPRDPEGNNAVLLDATSDVILNNAVSFSSIDFTALVVMKSTTPGGGIFVSGGSNSLAFTITDVFGIINATGTSLTPAYPRANLFDGQAHMIAWKVTSSTAELWVDGTMVSSATHSYTSQTRTQISLEGTGPIATYDEMLLWDAALTSTQIEDLAIAGGFPIMEGSASGTASFAGTSTGSRASEGAASGTFSFGGEAHESEEGDASGTHDWVGSSSGAADYQGSAAGTFTETGSATGDAGGAGSVSGAFTEAGTATGSSPNSGTASGAFAEAGTSSGSRAAEGSTSGAFLEEGSAAGSAAHEGSASGASSWSATAAGSRSSEGASSGDDTWAGASSGTTSREGSASGTDEWVGTGTSSRESAGSATGAFEEAGTSSGSSPNSGSSTGTDTWVGTSTGQSQEGAGAVTGTTAWAGSADGYYPDGTGSGTAEFAGTATGETTRSGSASGSNTFTGNATGSTPHQGSGSITDGWSGSVTGSRAAQGAASGADAWLGSATGESPLDSNTGTGSGAFSWTGSATGVKPSGGTATLTHAWVGTATSPLTVSITYVAKPYTIVRVYGPEMSVLTVRAPRLRHTVVSEPWSEEP